MNTIVFAAVLAALSPEVAKENAEDLEAVIRPGGVTQEGFWNKNAQRFIYAPSIKFHDIPGVDHYYVEIIGEPAGNKITTNLTSSVVDLKDVWKKFPTGYVTVVIEGKTKDDKQVGEVESRFFWKKAPYGNTDAYPKRVRSYREAAAMAYKYMLEMPAMKYLAENGKPDPNYRLNCYPTKMNAAIAAAMVKYTEVDPSNKDAAMKLARAAADYLLSVAEPKNAAFPGWTPTYAGGENAAGRYAGQCMTSYPASAGNAFISMYEGTKDRKYLDAAILIGETYLKLQDEKGEWPLKVMFKDGSKVGDNKLFPLGVIGFLRRLKDAAYDRRFGDAADKAEPQLYVGALKTWNWEGQFEDVEPEGMYANMTHHSAIALAMQMMKTRPGEKEPIAVARDVLRYSEDQFVDWERPFKDHTPMVWGPYARLTWHYDAKLLNDYPGVNEQYQCYCPVDSSAAKLIDMYLAMYRAEGKELDLAKARTLGDTMTFVQRDDGSIPTWWRKTDDPKRDWFNCLLASAASLTRLAELTEIKVRPGHPKLFGDAKTFEKIRNDKSEYAKGARATILREADAILSEPPVERVLEGRRLLTISRLAVLRLLSLSVAYRLTDDVRYLERAKLELKAVCGFTDWNPSHFLDTAEAMFSVAVAYDWLYDKLTESEREMIRKALVEKGLRAHYANSRWQNWWNNWNLVCHTGYLAAALSISDDYPELSKQYILAAVELMPNALKSYADGNFPEGPSYWGYATEYASCAMAMLESACGTTYGLDKVPGFAEHVDYLDRMTGPTGLFFNFSDSGAEPGSRPRGFCVASFYLAKHFNRPDTLAAIEMSRMKEKFLAPPEGVTRRSHGRLMPLIMFWLPESDPVAKSDREKSIYLGGEVPVAVMRSSWTDPSASFVAVKGGGPGHSHAHQDGGSFVYDKNGMRWFWDIGSENYHSLESAGINIWDGSNGGDRWTVGRYMPSMHNTLTVNGCLQLAGGDGFFVNPVHTGFDTVTLDLTPLYTNSTAVLRKVTLSENKLSINDEITVNPGVVVHWNGIVHGTPSVDGCVLHLYDEGKKLDIVGSHPWKLEDISKPWRSCESENPGFFRASMSATAPASGKISFFVHD